MSGASFNFTRYKVFGWILHRKTLKEGDKFSVKVDREYIPANGQNISLWTKGKVTGINRVTGLPTQDKVPGHTVLDQEIVPVSDSHFVAEADSEFWCINYTINRKRLPDVTVFSVKAGESKSWLPGTKLMFCIGNFTSNNVQYESPLPIIVESDSVSVTAVEDVYGFIFKDAA